MKVAAIINPQSGSGRTVKLWRQIGETLGRKLGGIQIYFTERPHHATEIAKQIATNDYDRLIIVGGDGTIHEVVNGLFSKKKPLFKKDFQVGLLTGGRGCDFIKTLGIPKDNQEMLSICTGDRFKSVDIGFVEIDEQRSLYYINSSAVGLGGEVARAIQSGSAFLPPTASYFWATIKSLISAKPKTVRVVLDEKPTYEGPVQNIFVCNGRYSGGGMLWSPNAKLDDGLFDVLIVRDLSRLQMVSMAPTVYSGSVAEVEGVTTSVAKEVTLTSDEMLWIELDGETYQSKSVRYTIMPHALNILY